MRDSSSLDTLFIIILILYEASIIVTIVELWIVTAPELWIVVKAELRIAMRNLRWPPEVVVTRWLLSVSSKSNGCELKG